MAIPMENKMSAKEANAELIVAKTIMTIDCLAARSKRRLMWNCEVHLATETVRPRQ